MVDEICDLRLSPNTIRIIKSRRNRWAEHVARMGETRNPSTGSVGMPERKKPLGSPRYRWKDNFKNGTLSLRMGAWNDLSQDKDGWWPLVKTKLRISIRCGRFLDELRNYQLFNTPLHAVCFELLTVVI